jgi:putative phage-type endonuclease
MNSDCCRVLRFGDDEAWKKERRYRIGSSEIAGILGMGYADQTPYTIWLEKTEGKRLPKGDDWHKLMEVGQAAEPFLRELFRIHTGKKVNSDDQKTVRINDPCPAFGASLDGWCGESDGSESVVELKFIGIFQRDDYTLDELPQKYTLQIQHQLAVTGASRGWLMACCGNEPIIREVPRHDRLINAMHAHAEEFLKMVESKTPPPVDGREATTKAIALRHGEPNPDAVVMLPEYFVTHPAKIAELDARLKSDDEELARLKNEIREHMGAAEYAFTADGETFSWKVSGRSRTFRKCKPPLVVKKKLLELQGELV